METTAYGHTTETQSGPPPIRANPDYVKTLPGVLKVVEIVLDVIILICCSIPIWYSSGGGWVQFVAASAMITTIILFILHFMNVISRLPGPWILIEFIYYALYVVLFVIAAIVAAIKAPHDPAIGATAFFTFANTIIYGVDLFLMYGEWKSNQHPVTGGGPITTTTTTTYETKTQY